MNSHKKQLLINIDNFNTLSTEKQYATILHEFAHYEQYVIEHKTSHTGIFGKIETKLLKTFGLKRKRNLYTNRYRYTELPELTFIRG